MWKLMMRLIWFVLTLGAVLAVTYVCLFLLAAVNGFEGTGTPDSDWAFWIPWVTVQGLAVWIAFRRHRWEILAALGASVYLLLPMLLNFYNQ